MRHTVTESRCKKKHTHTNSKVGWNIPWCCESLQPRCHHPGNEFQSSYLQTVPWKKQRETANTHKCPSRNFIRKPIKMSLVMSPPHKEFSKVWCEAITEQLERKHVLLSSIKSLSRHMRCMKRLHSISIHNSSHVLQWTLQTIASNEQQYVVIKTNSSFTDRSQRL